MTITSNDIKLFQAQDNTDNDSGGGSRTNTEIVDGDVNNLFPDISRIDTVSGDVALRKIFPTVTTDNRDVYYGAHSMIRKPPTDPKVSALIFHTDDPNDTRIEAQDKIESYVVASYKEEFWLYGNHVAGAKTATFLQNIESQPPNVGEVYLLKDGVDEQYIRITSVDIQELTLVYSWGNTPTSYIRRRILCVIDQALEFAFVGSSFHPSGQIDNTANTWATQVADAAKFYSTKVLAENALTGDSVVKVDSIFEQLVPASKKQTPLVNKSAMVQGVGLIGTGNLHSQIYGSTIGVPIQLGFPVTPNSITKVADTRYIDDGNGNIIDTSNNDIIVGSIDYKEGVITQNFVSGGVAVAFEIATIFDSNIQFSGEIKITQENTGNVFVSRLSPLPSMGDLYIDYRSNGKWYRLSSTANRIAGNETIGGDSAIGAGSLNDNNDGTGTVSVTFASTPDIDSSVIFSWGSAERLTERENFINDEVGVEVVIPLGQVGIDPLSFVMQVYGGNYGLKNVTSLADGTLVDASNKIKGRLDVITGEVVIDESASNRLPALNSQNVIIDFNYSDQAAAGAGEIKTVVASRTAAVDQLQFGVEGSGALLIQLGESVRISSVAIELHVGELGWRNVYRGEVIALRSNSAGQLIKSGTNQVWGTVSANGDINFTFPSYTVRGMVSGSPLYFGGGATAPVYENNTAYKKVSNASSLNKDEVTIKYTTGADPSAALSHNITDKMENIATVEIGTLPNVVGSVVFELNNLTFNTKNSVVYDNNGLQVGVIDDSTGDISMPYYADLGVMQFEVSKLFTDDINEDDDLINSYVFKTAATKLTTSSFQLSYESANGIYIATSDGNGVITGTDIDSVNSYVDTLTGMASIVFTSPVIPQSIKYDAVAESSLPLDPELLGLNPVRLPSDGRVPVFKAGYHLIIFNEVTTVTTNATPLSNDVETLARSGQAHIEVIDANGKRLDPLQYVADRVAGTVTFSPTLVLQDKYLVALTAPFSIVDRVEDMLLATDVQINGLITLSAGLSRDYTQGTTKVASALVWGDTGARVYNLFAQEIWDGGNPVWDDNRIGDNTTAQYDNINSPIQIDNESSTAGRWAVIFKSSTTVDVVHEKLGVVQSNVSISIDDISPINPATGEPYFTMFKEGFGGGWVTNNVIRLNTDSGDNNAWIIRTVQSGALSELTDSIDIEVRGDAN